MSIEKSPPKDKALLKATGSVLFAVVASAHHWLHTLLIALGLTSFGAGLLSLSPPAKMTFLLISLVLSMWFVVVAKRRWKVARPSAWVYLVSSVISIALVVTALPKTVAEIVSQPQQQQEDQHNQHHEMKK
ncbi:UPF0182 family protein [Paenibacillus sp. BR2-3]|uniref:hypothetical protein n=1 Tax=Paenibacillus sp. BR2-3 TaxID=3048494 RepID=UPI0039777D3D